MNKFKITFLLFFNIVFAYSNNIKLEKTKQKYFNAKSISYTAAAYYPNPDTDEVSSFSIFYKIINPKNKDYEFYSKSNSSEEFYKNGIYSEVNHNEKTIYKYEKKQNQTESLQSSRLANFGVISLLKKKWKYENEIVINGQNHSHYSFIESIDKYEGKEVKAVFHIYISSDYTISKFERKSYVDNKLGQTVTYDFKDYIFSKQISDFQVSLPKNYSLKYFERIELDPLKKNTKAPDFEAVNIDNKNFSSQNFLKDKTLFLFSSTNCGASKIVSDFITNPNFELDNNFKLVNVFGSDSAENTTKYFKNKALNFTVIANRKDIETLYNINGYPVLYLIDENGIITKVFDGYEQILSFLKNLNVKK